jgi:hypothetical protein
MHTGDEVTTVGCLIRKALVSNAQDMSTLGPPKTVPYI